MANYKGITSKILKNGTINIMVRFNYLSTTYPIKNFTKLYGCKTETQAYNKLQEVKLLISQGKNPFVKTFSSLNDIFHERLEKKIKNGEWTNSTPSNYKYFYYAFIKKSIGHKKLEKITYLDIQRILEKFDGKSGSHKNTLKRLLRPVYADAIKEGLISDNLFDNIDTFPTKMREKLELRTNEKHLEIIRKLYKAIPSYPVLQKSQDVELKMFMYLMLLTAHRFGELIKLKKENVFLDENKIVSPSSITKTKEDYHFPIPREVREYIQSIKSGLLFPTIKKSSMDNIFKRLLKVADVHVYKDKTISIHDIRRMMLTTMITKCKIDSVLADTCLSHKQRGVINHYLSFTYKDIEKAYRKFWKKVRKN